MKPFLALAALLLLTSRVQAQVREVMSPPASAGGSDTEYSPADDSNGIENFDPDWSGGLSVEVNAPSIDSGGDSGSVRQGPDIVEGTNDGPYVPSKFMSYQDAMEKGEEELASMGSVASAEAEQTGNITHEPSSSSRGGLTSKPPTADANGNSARLRPIVVPRETVAEAARENREKQAKDDKPKVIVSQDDSGGVVVTDEPAASQSPKAPSQTSK
jgi:hypothetical protein